MEFHTNVKATSLAHFSQHKQINKRNMTGQIHKILILLSIVGSKQRKAYTIHRIVTERNAHLTSLSIPTLKRNRNRNHRNQYVTNTKTKPSKSSDGSRCENVVAYGYFVYRVLNLYSSDVCTKPL